MGTLRCECGRLLGRVDIGLDETFTLKCINCIFDWFIICNIYQIMHTPTKKSPNTEFTPLMHGTPEQVLCSAEIIAINNGENLCTILDRVLASPS